MAIDLEDVPHPKGGDRTNLTETAYTTVLDMILDGRLPGGTIIEERVLTESLGISRTPLREALGRLEGERFIRRQGRKLVVHQMSERELLQLLHLRRVLEVETAALAAGRVGKREIAALRRQHDVFSTPEEQPSNLFWQIDADLHETIARACGNTMIYDLVRDLKRRTQPYGLDIPPNRYETVRDEHLAILDRIEAGDSEGAASAMAQHLDAAREDLIDKISRL